MLFRSLESTKAALHAARLGEVEAKAELASLQQQVKEATVIVQVAQDEGLHARLMASQRAKQFADIAGRTVLAFWEWGYPDLHACGPGLARLVKQTNRTCTAQGKALVRGQAS